MQDLKNFTILVVDDETSLREALVFDFNRRGFTVLEASNGRAAFEQVKKSQIDVVLTDVRMPDGDGVELLENVKALYPELPVVMFITGYADISVQESYSKGAEAIFSKPFDRNALFAAVMRAISSKEKIWSLNRSQRVNTDFNINLYFQDLNRAMEAKVLNIGFGGFFVALKDLFPSIDMGIDFSIQFGRSRVTDITGNGIVRWVRTVSAQNRPSGCGIEFEFLSDRSRSQIVQLVNELKTKSFIPIS